MLNAGGIDTVDGRLRLRLAQNDNYCTNSVTTVYEYP